MNHTLENDKLKLVVSALGAELQSIKTLDSSEEYLWQGDSSVWSGRAPVLFPIVGALKDSQMSHLGNTYSLPRHGFARRNTFEYIKDRQQLIFRLQSDQDTRSVYPWDFTLEIGYKLDDQKLLISYTVLNSSSNAANPMLFTIGSHPAFRLPLNDLSIDQFSIRFSDQEQLQRFPLDNNGLLKESRESFALDDGAIVLQNDTFADDALVFKNINSAAISLWQGSKERVRVDTGGAPHLGLWAKPGAAYVCIEPWFGYSDSQNSTGLFKDKPELKSLAPGESFHTQWGIELPSI